MKKLFSLVLSLSLMLCACGTPEETTTPNEEIQTTIEETDISQPESSPEEADDESKKEFIQEENSEEVLQEILKEKPVQPEEKSLSESTSVPVQETAPVSNDILSSVPSSEERTLKSIPKPEPAGDSPSRTSSSVPNNLPVQESFSYEQETFSESQTITVYITNTGTKYHRAGCQYLRKSCIPISLDSARLSYSPCSKCNPPQ